MSRLETADMAARIADLERQVAAEDGKKRGTAQILARMKKLVAQMDANRDSLGDACRICGRRQCRGVNDRLERNHAPDCPVAEVVAEVDLD